MPWLGMSCYGACLLVDVYEVNGVEHGRYHDAVKAILGHHYAIGVSTFQLLNIFLINITYSISSAKAMETIANISCGWHGKSEADCFNSTWALTIIFGAVQVVLSQVRNLEEAWWVSAAGTITSLGYSLIALILGCIYASNRLGTVGGIPATSVNKTFGILNALGAIGFSYNFTVILLEIQDTLRQPPKAAASMRPAVYWGITGSFVLYFVISVTGYASLGNSVPGFILEGYPDAPRWVLLVANICILLHMVSAYQVFGQPMFDTIESHVKAWRIRRAQRLTGPGAAEALARVTPKPKTRCSMDMAERHAPALAAA
ncbi:transmembrane amino acid transporter protein, partial [Helicosporidium sp. ATCC 50920]